MNESAATPLPTRRFAFTGRTADYFRIWAVSLTLSLLTLGVYSAWGKVRKRRYVYAHTRLEDTGFEYLASPLAILKGRVVAVLLFGGLALSGHVLPAAQIAFILLLLLLAPWIVVASSRFNARNSAWRNVRFAFDGSVREAAKVLLGFGAVAVVTAGLAYPWFRMRRARFIVERHRFGATPFQSDLIAGGFVVTYLLALLMIVGAFALMGIAAGITAALTDGSNDKPLSPLVPLATTGFLYASYLAAFAYVRARVGNLTANGTIAGPLRCRSTLRARDLLWLYVSNIVAVLATLGLAMPWVTMRMARYRADNLYVVGEAPLDAFAAASGEAASATGSEVSDLFDVDVSL